MNKVSIITVVYNDVTQIEDTILSVLKQGYTEKEYIIIDGGSTDGTLEVIKQYLDKITIFKTEPDNGIYDAMNKGVSLASGTWVNFLNSGDSIYSDNLLAKVFVNADSSDDVIYGSVCCFDRYKDVIMKPIELKNLEKRMIFCHQSSFVKRTLLLKYPFDTSFKISADYNLFYSLYKNGFKFTEVNNCISKYEIERGVSSKNAFLSEKENLKINQTWNKPLVMIQFAYKMASFYSLVFLKKILPYRVLKYLKDYKYRNH